jgi:hypothetical protein
MPTRNMRYTPSVNHLLFSGVPEDVLSSVKVGFNFFRDMLFTFLVEVFLCSYWTAAAGFSFSSLMTHEPWAIWLRVCLASL